MKDRVYIILGPTASGKTSVAIELAKLADGEIVSADSMQIYRGMDIGTAKPTIEERQGIVHHLFDVVRPDEAYSVAMWQQAAKECIRNIAGRGKTPIVAGGTGLYINALTYQLDFTQTAHDPALRAQLQECGSDELHKRLSALDADAAQRIHPNDKKRIIRRLEILQHRNGDEDYQFRRPNEEYRFVMAGLSTQRETLYERINRRVDIMVKQGLEREVRQLAQTYPSAPTSMQAIGYKEMLRYLHGEIPLAQAVEEIKRNSRRYAKRQMVWFRRDERIVWYDTTDFETAGQIAAAILKQA